MSVRDLGPLDWRAPIVDSQGRPSPEFQRRWDTQRGNNALIGTITFGAGAPTGTPADGAEYVDTSTTPYTVYIGRADAWHQAGAVAFTDLQDAPHAYASHGLALLRVKASADGVEFVTQSAQLDSLGTPATGQLLQRGASTWALVTLSGLLDGLGSSRGDVLFRGATGWAALAPGTAGNVLQTNGAAADPSWVTPSGGGGGGFGFSPPKAADFPVFLGTVHPTLTDDADVGLQVSGGASVSGDVQRYATKLLPTSGDFQITARMQIALFLNTFNMFGLCLYELATNKSTIFGLEWSTSGARFRYTRVTVPSGFVSNPLDQDTGGLYYPWYRIQLVGSTFTFSLSPDGKDWTPIYTEALTASFTTRPTHVGLGISYNSTSAAVTSASVPYWAQSF